MSKNKKSQFQRYWSRIDNSPGKLDCATSEQLGEVKRMVKAAFHSGHGMYRERITELKSLLQKYGSHELECNRNRSPIRKASHPEGLLRRPCSCGFEEALNQQEESKPERKIVCHAEGDKCHGCAHYQGKADTCEYAPDQQEQSDD